MRKARKREGVIPPVFHFQSDIVALERKEFSRDRFSGGVGPVAEFSGHGITCRKKQQQGGKEKCSHAGMLKEEFRIGDERIVSGAAAIGWLR